MNRGIVIAACSWSQPGHHLIARARRRVDACADEPVAAGVTTPCRRPAAAEGAEGKVEVNEVFWYGCSHCFALDPVLEKLEEEQAGIHRVRARARGLGADASPARQLFYTLQKLGRGDLHAKVFDTIHRASTGGRTDEAARALQLAFLKDNGVTEQQFNDAYDSHEVGRNVERAERFTRFEVLQRSQHDRARAYSTSVCRRAARSSCSRCSTISPPREALAAAQRARQFDPC
jgi:hypothetical protein